MPNCMHLQIIVLVGVEVPLMEFPCFDASKKCGRWRVLITCKVKFVHTAYRRDIHRDIGPS